LAHKIGGEFGITHGLATAILMPYIVDHNRQATDKVDQIEERLAIPNFTQKLRDLNDRLGIPQTLSEVTEVEITEEKFLKVLDRMSENAFNNPCTLTNPRSSSVEDIKKLYSDAFYGTIAINRDIAV
jgi:alcohol dehydrogenase class IV